MGGAWEVLASLWLSVELAREYHLPHWSDFLEASNVYV